MIGQLGCTHADPPGQAFRDDGVLLRLLHHSFEYGDLEGASSPTLELGKGSNRGRSQDH